MTSDNANARRRRFSEEGDTAVASSPSHRRRRIVAVASSPSHRRRRIVAVASSPSHRRRRIVAVASSPPPSHRHRRGRRRRWRSTDAKLAVLRAPSVRTHYFLRVSERARALAAHRPLSARARRSLSYSRSPRVLLLAGSLFRKRCLCARLS